MSASPGLAGDLGDVLREAARSGDLPRVESLLGAGAPVDAAGKHGVTPLRLAADRGHLDVIRRLVEHGADINAADTFFGSSVLEGALRNRHREVVLLLLAKGVSGRAAALDWAIENNDLEIAKAALDGAGVDPLELAVARRSAQDKDAALQQLLAEAKAAKARRNARKFDPDRLATYAGRYKSGDQAIEVKVAGDQLELAMEGAAPQRLAAVAERVFENDAGDLRLEISGRAGLVEWARVVRASGEVSFLSLEIAPEPEALRLADGVALDTAPKGPSKPWRQFRGTGASGIGDGQGAPADWDVASGRNIRFKTPIPGLSLASPIIDAGRVFVVSAVSSQGDTTFRTGLYGEGDSVDDLSEHSFRLYALDASSGAIVWEREVAKVDPTVRRHLKSSLANSTPATDGKAIVVLFGAVGVLAAYDREGQELWRREIGVLEANDPQAGTAEWGHASSPVIWEDLVFVQGDRRRESFLAAYRLVDGTELWKVSREEPSTWSTPTIVPSAAGDELVTNGTTIRAYAPRTGELLWRLGPNSEVVVATPVAAEGMVYLTAGYPPIRPIYSVRAGSTGDLSLAPGASSSAALAWSHPRGGTYLPTPVVYRGRLVTLNNNGLLTAYRADTGEEVYRGRVAGSTTAFSASPVAADGRLYLISEEGEVFVLRGEAEYELLAQHAMGEIVMATPAIAEGLLVVRTLGHVVGIADGEVSPEQSNSEGSGEGTSAE